MYGGSEELPHGESLGLCLARVVPHWENVIAPEVLKGSKVLVAAHNNVIRCLIHHLDKVPEAALETLEIPTGAPLVYDFDENLQVIGTKDSRGFRGKFLTEDAETMALARIDPLKAPLDMHSMITNNDLERERRRLGLSSFHEPGFAPEPPADGWYSKNSRWSQR
mmetsp:Transcript_17152/g.23061  ORF Transcript_17152/g.23061 Transcript_17152/m.23061 type:complete len:165 (-) Transcript_17152:492-986(-)